LNSRGGLAASLGVGDKISLSPSCGAAPVPTQVVEIVRPGGEVERKGEIDVTGRAAADGGVGISFLVDHGLKTQVTRLLARVRNEQGLLAILVNLAATHHRPRAAQANGATTPPRALA
jgi:hypothetical protein